MKRLIIPCLSLWFVAPFSGVVHAQYPAISEEVQAEAERRQRAAQKRSDEAWKRALPVIREWDEKGKPYIPWAAHPDDLPQAEIPAFPGAQGGGMYSFGGRGGDVYVVTNLNDRGPGSFRAACEAGGPRFVVFNVAGIIRLEEPVTIRAPYITIDGSSAPGDGVCIAGATVEIDTHDVIIRHMRFRRGETWVGNRDDSLGGEAVGNIMIDHVSASWGLDENMSLYRHMYQPPDSDERLKLPTVNITVQNSIFSEALNTYNHAFGGTLGGYNATFHRNLFACNTGRNPSVGMIFDFTYTNNVMYNWFHRTVDGGDHRSFYTIINNYYKPGPATDLSRPVSYRLLRPDARRSPHFNTDFGRAYVAGNVVEGNERVTRDNWAGGVQINVPDDVDREELLQQIRAREPYPHAYLDIISAEEAYEYVLANAGATLPKRDPVDERVIEMVRTGTVTFAEGEESFEEYAARHDQVGRARMGNGIIIDISQVGGYPEYQGEPFQDSSGDGIPDEWKIKYGLDPYDSSNATRDLNGNGYTTIECFLYGLDPVAEPQEASPPAPRTFKDLFWNIPYGSG